MGKQETPSISNDLEDLLKKGEIPQVNLGGIEIVSCIPSIRKVDPATNQLEGNNFYRFTKETIYPKPLVEALAMILDEYTNHFHALVTDKQTPVSQDCYTHAKDKNGRFVNFGYQIDMKGLTPEALEIIADGRYSPQEIAKILKFYIFEIENSLAMYGMMRGIFSSSSDSYSPNSFFGINFDTAIRIWEEYHQKPLVLGTVTDGKFQSMLLSEFGVTSPDDINPELVRFLSGFSDFFGPESLKKMINDGSIENYMFYMRTSYPISWLKNPRNPISIRLLEEVDSIKAIRRMATTFNVDDNREVSYLMTNSGNMSFKYLPEGAIFVLHDGSYYRPSIINDTKEALARMGLVVPFGDINEIIEKNEYRDRRNKAQIQYRLRPEIASKLGISPEAIVRAKPLWLHYGGYGHIRGPLTDGDVRGEIRRNIKMRGPYVLQREIEPTIVHNSVNGTDYAIIHRLFFAFNPQLGKFKFIGGFLDALPVESKEAKKGRLHGNQEAVWGQIVCEDESLVVNPNSLNYIKNV